MNIKSSVLEKNSLQAEKLSVLDSAHIGDIKGAWGTIAKNDDPVNYTGSSWSKKLLLFLVIMGPGLIVMIGDNDAGGVATYMQAGQNYGTSLLWTLLILIPVLIINQEMVARLGTVTGVGHARLITERFGKFWGYFSVGDLFILNFLTIVTEFIGVSQGMRFLGVSPYISVPIAALLLIIMVTSGSFRRWDRVVFGFIAFSFFMYPLALMTHPRWGSVVHDAFIPHIAGGITSTAILLIIGIVGTTVAPWQLFFQQSNVIDKRITPRWLTYERWDTIVGAFVTNLGASALMIAAAFAFTKTSFAGKFSDMTGVIGGFTTTLGHNTGVIVAIVLVDAAIIGAVAVTLSTAYAFGDVFNMRHSLHRNVKEAPQFYAIYSLLIIIAAAIVLIPHMPLGLMTLAVQALAGILLPSATVFLILLCNDKEVLGPWVNQKWLNAASSLIVGILVMLSFILAATTLFPSINVTMLTIILGCILALGLLAAGIFQLMQPKKEQSYKYTEKEKLVWRMPPLETLKKPQWSFTRKVGMYVLRGYLIIAVVLMIVKIIQLILIH
jgi:Mn2+/Fe2+ NRAMP family transporter